MSTARQVVDPYFLTTAVATGPAERAAIARPSLRPSVPLQWWWGEASSSLVSGAPKAPAGPSGPTAPGAPASPCRGCGS